MAAPTLMGRPNRWCIVGDMNIKTPVEMEPPRVMFSALRATTTTIRGHLQDAMGHRLLTHGALTPPDGPFTRSTDGVAKIKQFYHAPHDRNSYDHIVVSEGALEGCVVSPFREADVLERLYASYTGHCRWDMHVCQKVSDHTPVFALWQFRRA
jgi:hypothetical protein